jgi:hypothetical protein
LPSSAVGIAFGELDVPEPRAARGCRGRASVLVARRSDRMLRTRPPSSYSLAMADEESAPARGGEMVAS